MISHAILHPGSRMPFKPRVFFKTASEIFVYRFILDNIGNLIIRSQEDHVWMEVKYRVQHKIQLPRNIELVS